MSALSYCTIIDRNYLAAARVLALSLAEVAAAELHVLVLDDDDGEVCEKDEPFKVLRPADLELDRREFRQMAAIYDVVELATATKPWLLERLLEDTDGSVCFLDPDIEMFSPLTEAGELAGSHGIVLVPHCTGPIAADDLLPSELSILQAGVYNLGFVAVGTSGRPFVAWWKERLRRHCRVDLAAGMFVDQRWADLVPALFDHAILRHPGYDTAYWNLDTRCLRRAGGRYEVDGEPLRFMQSR